MIRFATLATLLCVVFLSTACPSTRLTDEAELALFTPAQLAWPQVKSELEGGYVAAVADGSLSTSAADAFRSESERLQVALDEKSKSDLATVPWPAMKPYAARGIDELVASGEIGPGVADSLRVHLGKFDETILRIQGATTR